MKQCFGCLAREGRKCSLGYKTTKLPRNGEDRIVLVPKEECPRPNTQAKYLQEVDRSRIAELIPYRDFRLSQC